MASASEATSENEKPVSLNTNSLDKLIKENLEHGSVARLTEHASFEGEEHWLRIFQNLLRFKAGFPEDVGSYPKTIDSFFELTKRDLIAGHISSLREADFKQESWNGGGIPGTASSTVIEKIAKLFSLRTLYLMALIVWKNPHLRTHPEGMDPKSRQLSDLISGSRVYSDNINELVSEWTQFIVERAPKSLEIGASDEWLTIGWVFELPAFFNPAFEHVLLRASSQLEIQPAETSGRRKLRKKQANEEDHRSLFEGLIKVPTPGPVIDALASFHHSTVSKDQNSTEYRNDRALILQHPSSAHILNKIEPMGRVRYWDYGDRGVRLETRNSKKAAAKTSRPEKEGKPQKKSEIPYDVFGWLATQS